MVNWYEHRAEMTELGIDWDLVSCLNENPQPFALDDIERVVAVSEGENDEAPWQWVILLKDARYAYLKGWCDYTGWDCRSGAESAFFEDAEMAIRLGVPGDPDDDEVKAALSAQVVDGKVKTRHEQVGEQMQGDA